MRCAVGLVALAVLAVRGAAAAPPQVTIDAQPRLIEPGHPAVVVGHVASGRAGDEVQVEQNPCGLGWGYLPTLRATTTAGGAYTVVMESGTAPAANTTLRARWQGVRSPPVRIFVRPWIVVRRFWGKLRVEVLGDFAPRLADRGRYAVVEGRRAGGLWKPIGRVRLRVPSSSFRQVAVGTLAVKLSRYAFVRAVLPAAQAKPCFVAVTSDAMRT